MKNSMMRYVEQLSDAEKLLIIQSYERFEQDGFIGDEPIRLHARAYGEETGMGPWVGIAVSMEKLAFECFRYFAKKHLETA
jgi:hypothetical protein